MQFSLVGLRSKNNRPINNFEESHMPERRVKIPFPLPNSPLKDAVEVDVKESTERWTEVTLEDGTIFRIKVSVLGAARVDGEYDQEGNPAYALKMNPVIAMVSTPPNFRRPVPRAPGIN
jgi:hypothetical protein